MNCSRKSTSGAVSFRREKPTSKYPTVVEQRDASTDTIAVHLRTRVGGCISENCASLKTKTGLHVCSLTARVTPMIEIKPTRSQATHDRPICQLRICFNRATLFRCRGRLRAEGGKAHEHWAVTSESPVELIY